MSTRSVAPERIKLVVFAAVSVLMAALMLSVLSQSRDVPGNESDYRAQFTDASFLRNNDGVRINGVPVGKVTDIKLTADNQVIVSFTSKTRKALPADTAAAVRYKNLLGDRYLELIPGDAASTLPKGALIPVERTTPAVDIDELTGGFKPLFQALDPEQINLLSGELISVFEGRAGAVEQMLQSIGSFTSTLADNDQVIGELITNLGTTLEVLDDRNSELDTSIVALRDLMNGLEDHKKTITGAVRHIEEAASNTASMMQAGRPAFKDDLEHLRATSKELNSRTDEVETTLADMGDALDLIAGIGVYGDFYNFYICDLRVRFTGPNGESAYTPWTSSKEHRCNGKPVKNP